MKQLNSDEYHPYYELYISKCPYNNINEGLGQSKEQFEAFLKSIPVHKQLFKYAPDKWTIKEVLVHIIDTERIFAYRALRIARQDFTALPGFDQDEYVLNSSANTRDFNDLISEYSSVRNATISLFNSFNEEDLRQKGTASNSPISVRALGFIFIGHQNHHKEIIEARYL
jgi:uncharacterized damage-inducible protein DinB